MSWMNWHIRKKCTEEKSGTKTACHRTIWKMVPLWRVEPFLSPPVLMHQNSTFMHFPSSIPQYLKRSWVTDDQTTPQEELFWLLFFSQYVYCFISVHLIFTSITMHKMRTNLLKFSSGRPPKPPIGKGISHEKKPPKPTCHEWIDTFGKSLTCFICAHSMSKSNKMYRMRTNLSKFSRGP